MPWERQAGEGSKAFAAFCAYRDLGPGQRSLRNVSRHLLKDYGLVARWSRIWGWVGRCMAWDAENERVKRIEQVRSLEGMARRQILVGQLLQSKATLRFTSMSDEEVLRLPISEAVRILEAGVRLERTARGPFVGAPVSTLASNAQVGAESGPTIMDLLRAHPDRIGPTVEALLMLRTALPELVACVQDDETEDASERGGTDVLRSLDREYGESSAKVAV
jgi:hypothetical protein